ncbi:MAG TPA: acetate/propionate family kinase [Bryobacteraceae bacterium]|nr:acetate/propionate family kinase [Bryobacteraceae bacterium]
MNILVPNLGSTSLKYQILEMPAERVLSRGRLERVKDYREAVAQVRTGDSRIDAVAFKAVHAGKKYRGTFVVDDELLAAMEEFLPAAPVHNAIYLTAMRAFQSEMPGVPLVAAFETEFHATMPESAARYGVPVEWREKYGVRKYGFHGASHRYVGERVAELLGQPQPSLRLVSCHLGGSSSICAIDGGRSVDTTMGFSPQSGLENASRHGDLDVFAVLYMMERRGWSIDEVRRQLASEGGLAGLSGVPGGDVRDLEQAAAAGNKDAALALEVFTYQVKKTIGAYAAAMGGLDAVAFTGGIGENSPRLRAACCAGLEFLGMCLDPERNESGSGDRMVSPDDSAVKILALATNEELIVARRAYGVLQAAH